MNRREFLAAGAAAVVGGAVAPALAAPLSADQTRSRILGQIRAAQLRDRQLRKNMLYASIYGKPSWNEDVLRRYEEAIALGYVIPYRVVPS